MAKKTIGDPRDHYIVLDALRGIAILGPVVMHIAGVWTGTGVPLTIPRLGVDIVNLTFFWGSGGRMLLFLLSGYLLAWTEEKRARSGIYSVRSYALRRALRILPAYYVAILVVVVLWPIDVSAIDVLMHVSFLHALTPQTMASLDPVWWSLTPTVVFYCLFPFILLKLPWVSQRLVLFGVFALISLVTRLYPYIVQIIPDTPSFFLYVLDMAQAYVFIYIFLAGVLLRMLVEYLNSRPASQLRLRLARLATAFFLIGAVSIVALLYLGLKHPIIAAAQGQTPWPLTYTTIELIVIAFFASAMLGSPLLRVVPKWRFLAFTGVISYSLFLLHNTVLVMVATPYFLPAVRDWLVGRGSLAVWATFSGYTLVTLAIAFTLSYLGYRYIESPFLSYKPK